MDISKTNRKSLKIKRNIQTGKGLISVIVETTKATEELDLIPFLCRNHCGGLFLLWSILYLKPSRYWKSFCILNPQ